MKSKYVTKKSSKKIQNDRDQELKNAHDYKKIFGKSTRMMRVYIRLNSQ